MLEKICQCCGREFLTDKNTRKYCSKPCAAKSLKRKTEYICSICGKTFYARNCDIKNHKFLHCSRECLYKGLSILRNKQVNYKCDYCGKEFYIKQSKLKNSKHYCSRECKYNDRKGNTINILDNKYAEIIISSKKYGTQKAIIDIKNIDLIKKYTWQLKYTKDTKCFYVVSSKSHNKPEIKLHRLLTNCPNDKVVDHINHNPLDNRLENLRIVTQKQNSRNCKIRKDNKGGFPGVIQTKSGNWHATYGRKTIGTFKTFELAVAAKRQYLKENGIFLNL